MRTSWSVALVRSTAPPLNRGTPPAAWSQNGRRTPSTLTRFGSSSGLVRAGDPTVDGEDREQPVGLAAHAEHGERPAAAHERGHVLRRERDELVEAIELLLHFVAARERWPREGAEHLAHGHGEQRPRHRARRPLLECVRVVEPDERIGREAERGRGGGRVVGAAAQRVDAGRGRRGGTWRDDAFVRGEDVGRAGPSRRAAVGVVGGSSLRHEGDAIGGGVRAQEIDERVGFRGGGAIGVRLAHAEHDERVDGALSARPAGAWFRWRSSAVRERGRR